MKKTLLLFSCTAMLGTLHTAQAAGTLIWDMSFTGTSSSPNADNIVVTDSNGASLFRHHAVLRRRFRYGRHLQFRRFPPDLYG